MESLLQRKTHLNKEQIALIDQDLDPGKSFLRKKKDLVNGKLGENHSEEQKSELINIQDHKSDTKDSLLIKRFSSSKNTSRKLLINEHPSSFETALKNRILSPREHIELKPVKKLKQLPLKNQEPKIQKKKAFSSAKNTRKAQNFSDCQETLQVKRKESIQNPRARGSSKRISKFSLDLNKMEICRKIDTNSLNYRLSLHQEYKKRGGFIDPPIKATLNQGIYYDELSKRHFSNF